MLSYQHMYHAGGKMDVHKHLTVCVLLSLLTEKERPLFLLDAFAGRGFYDLKAPEALKTKEAEHGYGLLRNMDAKAIQTLQTCVDALNKKQGTSSLYPGSPYLLSHLMRKQDELSVCEIHPQELDALKENKHHFPQKVRIDTRNAYEALKALLPPKQARGLVLIDPSYEIKSEYSDIARMTAQAYKKWNTGVFLIWYPLLKNGLYETLKTELQKYITDPNALYFHEWVFENAPERALGSGVAIINPPYKTDAEIDAFFSVLQSVYK